jgi:hypothetical protein
MVLGGRCPQTYKINYWAMGCSEKMKYHRKEEQEIVRSRYEVFNNSTSRDIEIKE